MKHVRLSDLKEIYAQLRKRKDVFPHVRQDKLRRMIEAGHLVPWNSSRSGVQAQSRSVAKTRTSLMARQNRPSRASSR